MSARFLIFGSEIIEAKICSRYIGAKRRDGMMLG